MLIKGPETSVIYAGSANLTRRNIADLNLESDLKIISPNDSEPVEAVSRYFDRIWENSDGNYTADFEKYHDRSLTKYLIYRIQEWGGLSSF